MGPRRIQLFPETCVAVGKSWLFLSLYTITRIPYALTIQADDSATTLTENSTWVFLHSSSCSSTTVDLCTYYVVTSGWLAQSLVLWCTYLISCWFLPDRLLAVYRDDNGITLKNSRPTASVGAEELTFERRYSNTFSTIFFRLQCKAALATRPFILSILRY